MLNAENFKTITQLRLNTLEVLKSLLENKKPIYIISRSKPQAILITIEEYGRLLELKRENKELKDLVNGKTEGKS